MRFTLPYTFPRAALSVKNKRRTVPSWRFCRSTMSLAKFRVTEHVIPTSHIRGYPRSIRTFEEDRTQLAIKQYTPLSNLGPQPGDLTLIAAHANGVPKEMYEPLWDELLQLSDRTRAFRIRNIWIADVDFQGASSVLNERKLGNDPSWFDHPRDLFLMVNHFREEMPRPLMGVGHSMGGNNIVNLSLMHPRLFEGLILIDPVIQREIQSSGNFMPAFASTFRRDIWPSRAEAEAAFKRNKFYQSWDPRCLDLWIQHGLRELPTQVHSQLPSSSKGSEAKPGDKPVTLTTPKHQEVFAFLRSHHPAQGEDLEAYKARHSTHPDLPQSGPTKPFYSPAPVYTFLQLQHLRPKCLYVFADESDLSEKAMRDDKLSVTGKGISGSGGEETGGVKWVLMEKAGHFVPFEKPKATADVMYQWIKPALDAFKIEEEHVEAEWRKLSDKEQYTMSEDRIWWTKQLKKPPPNTKL